MENVKKYCGYELHSLCGFMYMIRGACWSFAELRLHSFHSPAAIASELLKRIDVRSHSWPVKSVDLEYEQQIAHAAYFGGRFEWVPKGYMRKPGYQYDLVSAYPYAMQSLPSMTGGRWRSRTRQIPCSAR
jgi:DNA polymerase type B, organellar and viral